MRLFSPHEYSCTARPALFALFLCVFAMPRARAQNSYTTITSVEVTTLSNAVQVRVKADGLLQFRYADTSGLMMFLQFPGARNGTGKNFFNINSFPVSSVQLSTPREAVNGIGVNMDIKNFIQTQGSVTATPDSQGILFTIQSNRTIETKKAAASSDGDSGGDTKSDDAKSGDAAKTGGAKDAADKPDTSTQVDFADGLLSLRAVNVDINELMAAIARKTGLSVAIDDAVSDPTPRKISLSLRGVSPRAAITSIAAAAGLAVSLRDGIYMMSEGEATDLASYNLSGTASFRLQNTQAGTASGLLPNFLSPFVKVNPEQNAVVVTAPSQILAKIGIDLQRLDVPPPQILIEAIAVELTDSSDTDLGLLIGDPSRTSFSSVDTTTGSLSYNTIGKLPRTFEINLRALELKGRARVRARPRMAVINGRTANIFIGAQRFILTQFSQFGQNQNRIQSVDVGVKLQVTPLTGGNGEITTRLVPEVSNITELDLQSGLPVLSSRRAETTVRVKSGETIAIGGLTLDQDQITNRKIPFLGDLPLLGGLFRGKKRSTSRTELVVFITPRILNSTTNGVAPIASQGAPRTVAPLR